MDKIHPIIAQFQAQADLLDAANSRVVVDDAIADLAAWMALAKGRLSEDDQAVLTRIGGILYRDGLLRKVRRS